MDKNELLNEFDDALERTGWTKTLIAHELNVGKSTITNWFSRGSIPVNNLSQISQILDDHEFATAASEFVFGIKVHSEAHVQDTPQARYFSQAKEGNDRKALDPEIVLLIGKLESERTADDKRRVLQYSKELDEEIEELIAYKSALMCDWGLGLKGAD